MQSLYLSLLQETKKLNQISVKNTSVRDTIGQPSCTSVYRLSFDGYFVSCIIFGPIQGDSKECSPIQFKLIIYRYYPTVTVTLKLPYVIVALQGST